MLKTLFWIVPTLNKYPLDPSYSNISSLSESEPNAAWTNTQLDPEHQLPVPVRHLENQPKLQEKEVPDRVQNHFQQTRFFTLSSPRHYYCIIT